MGVLHIKSGDTFRDKVRVFGYGIEEQVNALNKLYREKAEFCIESFYDFSLPFDVTDSNRYTDAICLKWTSDDTYGLDLPECDYINPKQLFSEHYKGKLSLIRLPKCIDIVDMKYLDPQVIYLNTLVVKDGTAIINMNENRRVPGRLVIEKQSGNNKVINYGAPVDRSRKFAHYGV